MATTSYPNRGAGGHGIDLTTIPLELVKEQYKGFDQKSLVRPRLMDFFRKDSSHSGEIFSFSVEFSAGGGASSLDHRSWDTANRTELAKFALDTVDFYATKKINVKDLMRTRNDAGAYATEIERYTKACYDQFDKEFASAVYGDGLAPKATAAAAAAGVATAPGVGTEVTLANAKTAIRFFLGSVVDYGPAGAAPAGTGRIVSINRKGNILVLADVLDNTIDPATDLDGNPIAAPAAGDEVVLSGDWQDTTAPVTMESIVKPVGLAGWVPDADPLGTDSFLSVNRSRDVTRLAGSRVDSVALGITSIFAAIQQLATCMREEDAQARLVVMHPSQHQKLRLELDSQGAGALHQDSLKVTRGSAETHFESVAVWTALGKLMVIDDPYCPVDKLYILNPEDWVCFSMGGMPFDFGSVSSDGKTRLIERDAALELRMGTFYNIACMAPWNQGVCLLAP